VPYYVFAKKGFSEEEVGEMILDPLSLNGRYEIFQTVKKKLSEKSIYWYPLIHGRSGSKGKLYEPYVAINPSLITGLFEFPLKRIGKTFADSGFSFERKIFPEKAGIKFRGEIYPITPFPILSIKDNFPKEEFASQICSHIEREFFPGSCIREFGIPKETNVDDDIPF